MEINNQSYLIAYKYNAQGDNSEIKFGEDGKITVNGANVLATIEATNGVIHIVDKVLLPPEK